VADELLNGGGERVAKYEARTEVTGSVWKIVTDVGQALEAGDTIMIVESMKMEIPVLAEEAGTIAEFRVREGASVAEGQVVAVLDTCAGRPDRATPWNRPP
jgi:acetyl-CoA carboxylase biotin carboxyl carrier protein